MRKYICFIGLFWGTVGVTFSQNFRLNWQASRLFDVFAPSIVLGGEFNTPYSQNKTIQLSLGLGKSGREIEFPDKILSSLALRYGIEQKYFYDGEAWKGAYLSYAFEARHMQIISEEWERVCESGNCYEQIQNKRLIRNTYNLMGRLGFMKEWGKNFYYDLFLGFGAKFAKKTNTNIFLDFNQPFKVADNHFLYPAFSLGFRVGFILK